jgi:PAS domain S-box-containing protein
MLIRREQDRLDALAAFRVLDTAPEAAFDRIVALAADLFDTPIALVSLVDENRQWFKARVGLDACWTPREQALCAHALDLAPHEVMVVEDATLDPRFADNPQVVGAPHIRFYAGAVLSDRDGFNLGTLCVIDTRPRLRPTDAELARLRTLAHVVVDELERLRAERRIQEQQRLLMMAEQMSGVGRWRLDIASGRAAWSDEVYRIHGVDPQDFDPTYDNILALYNEDERDALRGLVDRAVRQGEGCDVELRLRRPDGELRDVAAKAMCDVDAAGAVIGLIGVFQDITDWNRVLREHDESHARFRLMADNAADVIMRQPAAGGFCSFISPSVEAMIGYTPADFETRTTREFIIEEDRPVMADGLARMLAGESGVAIEFRSHHKDGHVIWAESRPRLLPEVPGAPREMVTVIRDISERKAMEAELIATRDAAREQARRAALAEQLAGLGHWRLDVQTRAMTWSDEMYAIYGLPRGTPLQFDAISALTHPDDVAERNARLAAAAAGAPVEQRLIRIIRSDGEIRCLASAINVETGADGRVVAIIGTVMDVTEQKRVEADILAARDAAREQARRAALAEKLGGLGYWRLEVDSQIVSWSEQMSAIHGLPHGAKCRIEDIAHPDDAAAARERINQAKRGDPPTDTSLTRIYLPDGRLRYLAQNLNVEHDASGRVVAVIGTVIDVTDRKLAEIAVEESEARYRLLAETAHDIIMQCDLEGRLIYIAPSVEMMTGFRPEELIGRPALELIRAEDAPTVLEAVRVQIESRGAAPTRAVEYRGQHKDGREIWFEARPTLAIDPHTGRMCGITDVVRDVTARKALEAELREARAAAEQAAQVKSEFLSNMSHELRTPLTSIIGFTELTIIRPDLPETARGYISRVRNASKALLSLVNDILDFSKLEAGQVELRRQPTELEPLCRATLDLFAPQAASKALDLRLELAPGSGLSPSLDPDRLRQVLTNLVGNAVKFTESGSVTLAVAYDMARAELRVAVTDTGAGIAEDKLDRLFQRFSQVDGGMNRPHGGTGLGLAICKGLVEAMGGEIGAESMISQGSRFWFRLPAPLAETLESRSTSAHLETRIDGLRALVVDDNPANRELARVLLTERGVSVSEAADGEAAVRLSATQAFDVILMDLRMPGLDGLGARERIRGVAGPNAETPILAFTAHVQADERRRLQSRGFDGVIQKPIESNALVSAVSAATIRPTTARLGPTVAQTIDAT